MPKMIEWAINRNRERYGQESIRIWQLIFESWNNSQIEHDHPQYDLETDIKRDGWSPGIVRRFIEYLKPTIKISPRFLASPVPPYELENDSVEALIRIEIECTGAPHGIDIPDDWLSKVINGITNNLVLTVALCNETEIADSERICPIEPDDTPGIDNYQRTSGISGQVIYYASLLDRVAQNNPKLAKAIIATWPADDFIFARLRVWAMGKADLASADDFAQAILKLSDDVFWSSDDKRDLLLAMKKRWNEMSVENQRLIENRIRLGRSDWVEAADEKLRRWRAYDILNRFQWLKSQGCQLSIDFDNEITRLQVDAPEWKPEIASGEANSMEGRSGRISVDEEYNGLMRIPIKRVLDAAKKITGRSQSDHFLEHKPFNGLCKCRPKRAYLALKDAATKNEFPQWAWRSFLCCSERKADSLKFAIKVASLICSLPDQEIIGLQYETTDWFENSAQCLSKDATAFDSCFEKLANALAGRTSLKSNTQRPRHLGIDTYNEASNSAAGKLVESVFKDTRLERDEAGIIASSLTKLEKLLSPSGPWRLHALTLTATRLCWLYKKNTQWTEQWLISVIDSNQRDEIDAFWSGYFMNTCFVNPEMFLRMKKGLLSQCVQITTDTSSSISQEMAAVLLDGWSEPNNKIGTRMLDDTELRDALLDGGDELRSQVLWQLKRYCINEDPAFREKWRLLLVTFLQNVWPRQRVAKNPEMTARLYELLLTDNGMFASLINVLEPLLTRLDGKSHPHLFLHDKQSVFSTYPLQLLLVLGKVLPEEVIGWPYGVNEALKWISDAKPELGSNDTFIRLNRKWLNR